MTPLKPYRTETDSMGEVRIPLAALWGASTQRAVDNFPISGLRFPRPFIRALGLIKQCAAAVNKQDGTLEPALADAIQKAAARVAEGLYDDQFVVDIFQTGSGTSTNMNANEVIANLAAESLGGSRGDRGLVHPNDHVNAGQSSNDVVPTATQVAALTEITGSLIPAMERLRKSLRAKQRKFSKVVKTGRTHLQDATPVTLGQEFSGYASQVTGAIRQLRSACRVLSLVPLGGTAVGTGLNAREDFAGRVLTLLSEHIGQRVRETSNHFQAQSTIDPLVTASGALKLAAVTLTKIANDIRWMGSGPRAGLGEITLPAVQPGSSIMPGKVNPVMAESLLQVCAQVIGNDTVITMAGQSGNFELNVMQPVAAYNLLQSIAILATAVEAFQARCLEGVEATGRGPELVEKGLALCTALVPHIGYDRAAAIAREACATGQTIRQVATRTSGLTAGQLDAILDPLSMTRPAKALVRTSAPCPQAPAPTCHRLNAISVWENEGGRPAPQSDEPDDDIESLYLDLGGEG
jgi:fumarate hydratase class II